MSRTIRKNRKTGLPERDTYHRNTHPARSCSHGGDCPHCLSNREHKHKVRGIIEEGEVDINIKKIIEDDIEIMNWQEEWET